MKDKSKSLHVTDNKPTKERLSKGSDEAPFDGSEGRTTRLTDSVIGKLYSRKQLSKAQHDAAEKFYTHYYYAGLSTERARGLPRDRVDCEGGFTETERQLYHRSKFNQALKCMSFNVSCVVCAVVTRELPLITAAGLTADALSYASRSDKTTAAMTSLKIGLDELAEHFGLIPRRRHRYAWMDDGARPEVHEELWETEKSTS